MRHINELVRSVTKREPGDDSSADASAVTEPTDVKFVGPNTAVVIGASSFEAVDILEKNVSYDMLVDAGVNHGVAAKIRREHSLAWSFEGSEGEDLARRSSQVRGLRDEERAWIAASSGDWEDAEPSSAASADGGGSASAAEAAWRDRSKPDPVTELSGIGEARAEQLAEGGINSVRSMATADPERVADVLGLDAEQVREWRDAARERR